MAVLEQELTESSSGFKKEIDEGGLSLLLDTVQIYMYQFPIKSSMRESCSNAIDSITEKNVAKILLKDPSRIPEFFVEREGEIYKDSRFDKSYYDLKFLSKDDTVYMTYQETDSKELRDRITIRDNGVGLGENRLEGYFKISYSSKRLSTKTLGTFGLGAKSPLSTGVDNYSLKTAHNGKEFSFLIYKDKIDNCYSKWNADGSLNDYIVFSQGTNHEYHVYYKKTTSTNYVEISWDVKKHQKRDYIDAVKSQLLYFKNPIKFLIKHGNSWDETINFQATTLHETDDYILAEQHYFSRPHLIINGVCYGFIEFQRIELDQKYGSIGLKMNMEDVTVTPSRESLVWDGKTKTSILKSYENLAKSSELLINETLKKLGFLDWLKACASINTLNYDATKEVKVLHNLASLTGFSSLSLKYKETKIKYSNNIVSLLATNQLNFVLIKRVNEWNSRFRENRTKLKRIDITDTAALQAGNLYFLYGSASINTSAYLTEDNKSVLLIRAPTSSGEEFRKIFKEYVTKQITLAEATSQVASMEILKTISSEDKLKEKIKSYNSALYFLSIMMEEKALIYDEVKVPDDYKMQLESDDLDDKQTIQEDVVDDTPAEKIDYSKIRKLNGEVLIQYPRIERDAVIVACKTEMKLSELQECTDTLVYGTKEDLPLLHFLYIISRDTKNNIDEYSLQFKGNPRVCIISKQIEKHFKPYTHVSKYLLGKDKETLCKELKTYFTALWASKKLSERHRYFTNLTEFSPTLKTTYKEVVDYINKNKYIYGWSKLFPNLPDEYKDFIQKSSEIQLIAIEAGIEKATEVSVEKYKDDKYANVEVFDKDILDKVDWLMDFDNVFGTLFSEIESLADYSEKITPKLAMEIKEIIEFKKDRLEKDYPDLCC